MLAAVESEKRPPQQPNQLLSHCCSVAQVIQDSRSHISRFFWWSAVPRSVICLTFMTLVARQSTLRRCGLLLPSFVSRQLVYTAPVFAASVSKADDCPVFKTVIKPLKVFIALFVNRTGVGPVNRVGLDYRAKGD